MASFENSLESTISRWHAITPPNAPARRVAAELADTIKAFETLRGQLAFEDEPSSFESALLEAKDTLSPPAEMSAKADA